MTDHPSWWKFDEMLLRTSRKLARRQAVGGRGAAILVVDLSASDLEFGGRTSRQAFEKQAATKLQGLNGYAAVVLLRFSGQRVDRLTTLYDTQLIGRRLATTLFP